jgi:vanillate O-demethylase ferredoxin subunit
MKLVVARKMLVATDVVQVTFEAVDGSILPKVGAGSHIAIRLGQMERRYSLTSLSPRRDHYQICVQRARPSRGASDYVHDTLQPGAIVEADGPFNGFPMLANATHSVIVAGGIGITPFFTIAQELKSKGASFEVHYSVRSRDRMLPTDTLGDNLTTYVDDEGAPLDLRHVLDKAPAGSTFYACGPRGMLEAIRTIAHAAGMPAKAIRVESFGAAQRTDDAPVEVRLDVSDVTLHVRPGQSILNAVLDAGVWATHECNRGECGSCYVSVLEGAVDHRDICLSPGQRASGMCPCVSWASGPRLVLAL